MINLNMLSNDISNSKTKINNNSLNIINKFYRLLNDDNLVVLAILYTPYCY